MRDNLSSLQHFTRREEYSKKENGFFRNIGKIFAAAYGKTWIASDREKESTSEVWRKG